MLKCNHRSGMLNRNHPEDRKFNNHHLNKKHQSKRTENKQENLVRNRMSLMKGNKVGDSNKKCRLKMMMHESLKWFSKRSRMLQCSMMRTFMHKLEMEK